MADASLLEQVTFDLPPERIAQTPAERREDARLLVAPRSPGTTPVEHTRIGALPSFMREGDLLIVNSTRVLPARLRGRKPTGGQVEALLLGPALAATSTGSAPEPAVHLRALVKSNGRMRPGLTLCFEGRDGAKAEACVTSVDADGEVVLAFTTGADAPADPYELGEAPLPPYIRRDGGDERRGLDDERYQTVYARVPGAVAAPTAGLHLSHELLGQLDARGVRRAEIVLHVGIGTFRPPRPEDLAADRLHAERYVLPDATAAAIDETRARGGRVIAVGTTSARVLETCARPDGGVDASEGETTLFLRPGSRFAVVDGLLTNFHLPGSSLLLLVSAFAGRERVLDWYAEAIRREYRFFSYGDAMLIL